MKHFIIEEMRIIKKFYEHFSYFLWVYHVKNSNGARVNLANLVHIIQFTLIAGLTIKRNSPTDAVYRCKTENTAE